ncbi:hypothetical protein ABVT39_027390 [Epinephelus coioides]
MSVSGQWSLCAITPGSDSIMETCQLEEKAEGSQREGRPGKGDYEKGVDHLTNAIAVCGQPQQLLQVLQQTLPPPVFQMLLTKLPSISQRIVSAQSLSEDDIE